MVVFLLDQATTRSTHIWTEFHLHNIIFVLEEQTKQEKYPSSWISGRKIKLYDAITLLESSTGNGTTRHLVRRSTKNDP